MSLLFTLYSIYDGMSYDAMINTLLIDFENLGPSSTYF